MLWFKELTRRLNVIRVDDWSLRVRGMAVLLWEKDPCKSYRLCLLRAPV